jgi:O-antigen/teichoic acid export membrane protein
VIHNPAELGTFCIDALKGLQKQEGKNNLVPKNKLLTICFSIFKLLKFKYTHLVSDIRFSEILSGSVWTLSARILTAGVGLTYSVIVARFYGAELVGIIAMLNTFLMLTTLFTVMGTNTSILRLIPEHLANYSVTSALKVYRKTQYMIIIFSLVTGSLFFYFADLIADKVFSKPYLSFYFAIAAGFIVFKSLMLFNTHAVRGLKLIRAFAFMLVLPQSFNLILLILLSLFWSNRNIPVYAMLGGFTLTGIMGWIIMEHTFLKRIQPNDAIRPMSVWKILSISLPMFMTGTMVLVIGEIGVIMLGMLRSEAEVGYYSIAIKIATLASFILQSINSMAAPKFSELFHSGNIDELFHVAKKSSKLIFWTTLPVLFGIVIFGKPILSIIFGNEFGVAYPALLFLAIGQFVNAISGSTGYFLNMTGNQNIFKNIMLIATLINIVLNLVLISNFGITGAAISAMISLSFWNIAALHYIKSKYNRTTGYFPIILH